ncbi:DUF833-domain-containing protein [Punctularia strigosozonata HHB-11173 SS5]|uniref:DUF833-domain-containing protein n=1 Tax=Punctularia strigosozonata (strain HHB-11173) TaxID=741275 RepID=UPI0004417906|nr:DUF833-domain-containing protein [Punctularia strigosozonata HHB-11173 SS5]EIN12811.1 DUF833-domain-containing protein [Punctularia strigosozonata HHB-11173 SS5]
MCIALWALDHPDYALVLASNRDEFLSRPTERAHFHHFEHEAGKTNTEGPILSGRDLKAGGTWLGLNRSGKIAVLTNITEPLGSYTSSRGHLVSSFLLSDLPADTDVENVVTRNEKYAGFNLVYFDPITDASGSLSFSPIFLTNHGGGGPLTARPLTAEERRCGGLSNGIDGQGADEWPKVQVGIRSMREVIESAEASDERRLVEDLFHVLEWCTAIPPRERAEHRNTIHIEPYPVAFDPTHATDFYGTRLSTVILVRRDGKVLFVEREPWRLSDGVLQKQQPPDEHVFRMQISLQNKH